MRKGELICSLRQRVKKSNGFFSLHYLRYGNCVSTFHVSGKFHRHNVRIWGSENPNASVEHERESLTLSCVSTFHVSGKFHRHNVRIWGSQNPNASVEHERESLTLSCVSTFHVSGKFHRHNVRIWGSQNPNASVEHERENLTLIERSVSVISSESLSVLLICIRGIDLVTCASVFPAYL
ncbi:hypothetical protein AVEN_210770-1 [Araneus ventricosus]|uniref:Uncharacterized protein n=1 Tax=Araneus ventricosus TaxID=182803 RepID=A0A4Y2PQJ0_ARAVE|nr:hypothetical protein AVEN_210770-1 [Araneus ventricosus]